VACDDIAIELDKRNTSPSKILHKPEQTKQLGHTMDWQARRSTSSQCI